MSLSDELRLRSADAADLPLIIGMRESVGWAVHDWALHAMLEPPDARCLVVVDESDRVVGVGSGIAYDDLGIVSVVGTLG
jgi:hypothetical protein